MIVTRGLLSIEEDRKIQTKHKCAECSGTGDLKTGVIATSKGLIDLFDNCPKCNGQGRAKGIRIKRRKAKVEVF